MRRPFLPIAAAVLLSPMASTAAEKERPMMEQLREIQAQVAPKLGACEPLAKAGDCDASRACVLKTVPEDTRTPAHDLFLGNVLFNSDRETSYKLHKRAYEAFPKDPLALLEWGMEQHRAGEHAGAVTAYRGYLEQAPSDVRIQALLADCLIRVGKPEEAVQAWPASGHKRQHIAIEQAISEIYGKPHPSRRRCDLWKQVKSGDKAAVDRLLLLDVHWELNWWNRDLNAELLQADAARLKPLLASDAARQAEVASFVSIMLADEDGLADAVKKSGWFVGSPKMPQSSLLASFVLERVLSGGLEKPESILERFGPELRKRSTAPASDVDALNILAFLSVGRDREALAKIDKQGWEQYGDARFALSSVVGVDGLAFDHPELTRAVKQFPSDARVMAFAVDLARKSSRVTAPLLVQAIQAEFREPAGLMGRYDSYRLKTYFALLKEELAKQSAPASKEAPKAEQAQ